MNGGILFIDKEAGMTSRKVDNIIGRIFHTKKVGHLGTLDPFATGLLICGVNAGNKALRFALDEDKTYVATLELGSKTDSGDLTGNLIKREPIPNLTEEVVKEAVENLKKETSQIPPMTSAIKVDGTALYKLAHEGKEIERACRPITVYYGKLLSFESNHITFEVKVSKGTYIRTLGETLASHLGTVGHLLSLRRTNVGPFRVEDALRLDQIDETSLQNPIRLLRHMETVEVDDVLYPKVLNGVKLSFLGRGDMLLLVHHDDPIAVYAKEGDHYACLRGLQ